MVVRVNRVSEWVPQIKWVSVTRTVESSLGGWHQAVYRAHCISEYVRKYADFVEGVREGVPEVYIRQWPEGYFRAAIGLVFSAIKAEKGQSEAKGGSDSEAFIFQRLNFAG